MCLSVWTVRSQQVVQELSTLRTNAEQVKLVLLANVALQRVITTDSLRINKTVEF